jgi:hypothetical protein
MVEVLNGNVSLRDLGLAFIMAGFNGDDGFHGGNIEWVYLSKRLCCNEEGK